MKKLNKKSIKEYLLNNKYINLDNDGQCNFIVTQVNEENFCDINPKLKQQLEDEGKYNSWIGFITYGNQHPYSIQALPIYGSSQQYITKWFTNEIETTIDQCLNDRQMKLLKRANDYIKI